MINKPTTRDQAVSNAIEAAEMAAGAQDYEGGGAYAQLARAWVEIAQVMPVETLMSKFVDGLTHEEARIIRALRNGDLTTVHPDFLDEAKTAIAMKNEADKNLTYAVSPEEREIVDGLRAGTHLVMEFDEEENGPIHKPGDRVLTKNASGKQLEFTVMQNGDLVLEKGQRDINRVSVATGPLTKGVRTSQITAGAVITEDALKALRAIVAAKIIHSTEAVHKMAVTDVDRYSRESLTVMVTASHYEVSSP